MTSEKMTGEEFPELGELNTSELAGLIENAKLNNQEEIDFEVNGEPVKLKLRMISPGRVLDRMADGW